MSEAAKPAVKLSPHQLAIMAELTRRGIPFTPPTVDEETGWAASKLLGELGYDFDIIADREEQMRIELELEAAASAQRGAA